MFINEGLMISALYPELRPYVIIDAFFIDEEKRWLLQSENFQFFMRDETISRSG